MNIKFEKILIVSDVEKTSRLIKFGQINVITGASDSTGKSSILKSIYYAFGADVRFEDEWLPLKTRILVRFSIDSKSYTIIRSGDQISIFDDRAKVLISTNSVTRELSPFIAKLFNFELLLTLSGKNSETLQATPAFAFLPFYIDQDLGWSDYFGSFKRLGMFSNWQDSFKNYHSGIRPTEYYEAVGEIKRKTEDVKNLTQEGLIIEKTRAVVSSALEIDEPNELQSLAKIEDLVSRQNELYLEECEARKKLLEYSGIINEIHDQQQTAKELKEASFAELNQLKTSKNIVCSRCGSIHESKIYHEYVLLADIEDANASESNLLAFETEISQNIKNTSSQLDWILARIDDVRSEIQRARKSESLSDTINSYALEKTNEIFKIEVERNSQEIGSINKQISELEAIQSRYIDKKRSRDIKNFYLSLLGKYFHDLSIDPGSINQYKAKFTPPETSKKTGSRAPRQMLAVYYAFISTAYKYSTCAKLPIVIDSPKQQEQDAWNSSNIIEFCLSNRPKDSQIIVATLNYEGNNESVKILRLNEKKNLLSVRTYCRHKKLIDIYQTVATEAMNLHE